jgi:hypothetical protein
MIFFKKIVESTACFAIFGSLHCFFKAPIFFAENWQKSQKVVIITSTPVKFCLKTAQMATGYSRTG